MTQIVEELAKILIRICNVDRTLDNIWHRCVLRELTYLRYQYNIYLICTDRGVAKFGKKLKVLYVFSRDFFEEFFICDNIARVML